MAYQIDRYNKTLLTVVEDGTIDATTDLRFIGKNYAGYGEIHNENFLYLLENFSSANQPPKPISGQIWFDSGRNELKYYDGTQWRQTGGSEIGVSAPTGLNEGDFWWDSGNDQLYVYNGTEFVLIGPEGVGTGLTRMVSQTVLDSSNGTRDIIVAFINDSATAVFSATSFTINQTETLSEIGYGNINRGITLRDSTDGFTTSDYRFKGTATNADALNQRPASDFITADNPDFVNQITTGIDGISIASNFNIIAAPATNFGGGAGDPLVGVIRNESGAENEIRFRTKNDLGNSIPVLTVNWTGLLPATDSTFDLGSPTLKFGNIYADSFSGGQATQAESLRLNSTTYLSASVQADANTIAARDGNADIYANEFRGIATSAKYADLAEKYTTDKEYPTGTVITVGGEFEATIADEDSFAIGVVSAKPAYLMNASAEGQALALKGRVPVRVSGPVRKGEQVFTAPNGSASTAKSVSLVGIALEDKDSDSEGLVECVLKL